MKDSQFIHRKVKESQRMAVDKSKFETILWIKEKSKKVKVKIDKKENDPWVLQM